jgi:hypothetical protein
LRPPPPLPLPLLLLLLLLLPLAVLLALAAAAALLARPDAAAPLLGRPALLLEAKEAASRLPSDTLAFSTGALACAGSGVARPGGGALRSGGGGGGRGVAGTDGVAGEGGGGRRGGGRLAGGGALALLDTSLRLLVPKPVLLLVTGALFTALLLLEGLFKGRLRSTMPLAAAAWPSSLMVSASLDMAMMLSRLLLPVLTGAAAAAGSSAGRVPAAP